MAEEAQDKAPSLVEQWSLPDQEQTDQSDSTVEKKTEEASPTDAGSEDVPAVSAIEAPAAEVTSEKSGDAPVAEDANPVVEDPSPVVEDANPVVENSSPVVEDSSPVVEESNETSEQQEETQEEEKPEIKIETAPADFRFPTTNQTRHCFTRYIEYHRCVAAKGEDASECDKFAKYYRSLCPSEWVERWNEQRENGTFPGPL